MTDVLRYGPRDSYYPPQRDVEPSPYVLGNPNLPIAEERGEIERALIDRRFLVAEGPTGSGKTTQMPQYACELKVNGKPYFDNILMAVPRIVVARTLADRVADEIAPTGRNLSVGYYTSKEGSPKPQREQDIAFATTGKVDVQLLHGMGREDPNQKRLVVADEVHEWSLEMELLIAILTEKTDPNSRFYDKNLTAVAMSATMEGEVLMKHFRNSDPAFVKVDVPMYEVRHSVSSKPLPEVSLQLARVTGGKVLAFLPGKGEIRSTTAAIAKLQEGQDPSRRVPVIPLHGQLTKAEQRRAFVEYPKGSIVLATNAAESSLTFPGVVGVVDSGKMRVDRVRYDIVPTGSKGLYEEDAPQANLLQRYGRVGRTAPGVVVTCPQGNGVIPPPFKSRPEYGTPAIQRSQLDGTVLHLNATGFDTSDFRFVHEPPKQALDAAKQRLFVLGALDKEGNVTERGKQMERLPLDPEYSCMVTFAVEKGYKADVIQNVVDIAAIMQRGGIIKRSPNEQRWQELLATDSKGDIAEKDSDFIAQLEAYVTLKTKVKRDDWGHYDVIKHSAELVEQDRASLIRTLGIEPWPVSTVAANNRKAVLTCINAGQLNQLWRQKGEQWNLLDGPEVGVDASESSVVKAAGRLATGSLFTLGTPEGDHHTLQDLNCVPSPKTLAQSAEHLVQDTYSRKDAVFDPDRGELVARVERRLGASLLGTYDRTIDIKPGSPEAELARERSREQSWKAWPGHKTSRIEYSSETVDEAIQNPESRQYGIDPITSEPLYAWRGGKGQWCRTRDIAIGSLEAHKVGLAKRPMQDERRAIKDEVNSARIQLTTLKKQCAANPGSVISPTGVREHLRRKSNTREWLDEARRLLGE